ncbi:beta-lactamase family protein [Gemmatimonas groenlandica]|uniref:Beta-lactamase family protein n=2 Tax=Gemmatimonas groenlandica TaxID=2732249 RepID=A0A6M4ILW0_9BACT|nr:beta-lactamase family protein [Gemmatimonas groenlandica]
MLPGVVVNVRLADGRSYTLTSGVADLETKRTITPTDHFRVGSITKTMVATIILQLHDEGRLSIDSTVAKYLPNVVPNGDRMTVRQVLNHSAGLASYTDDEAFTASLIADPARTWTPSELLGVVARQTPYFTPGEPGKWAYSNTSYLVLGMIAERVTGSTLGRELQIRVFDRVGMKETSYPLVVGLPSPFAQGYADITRPNENLAVGTLLNPSWAGAAGAVVSTAGDIAHFAEAVASGSLVSASAFVMQQQAAAGSAFRIPGESYDTGYGLGVILGGGWIGHNGAIPGYEAQAFAKRGLGSIGVVINRTTDDDTPREIYAAVRKAQFGQ